MEVDIQPTAREMLAIIAVLWMENDSLRQRLGGENCGIHFSKRTFSNEEIVHGGHIGPKACVKTNGSIVISMES